MFILVPTSLNKKYMYVRMYEQSIFVAAAQILITSRNCSDITRVRQGSVFRTWQDVLGVSSRTKSNSVV